MRDGGLAFLGLIYEATLPGCWGAALETNYQKSVEVGVVVNVRISQGVQGGNHHTPAGIARYTSLVWNVIGRVAVFSS